MPTATTKASTEETTQADAPAVEEAPPEPPKQRYFASTIEVYSATFDQDVTDSDVENMLREQVTLPQGLNGALLTVAGGKVTGTSEGTEAGKPESGFGRHIEEPEEEAAPKK